MKPFRLLLLVLGSALLIGSAQAQINVTLGIKQRLFILHEPVLATVTITNQTGRDITLGDTKSGQWFGFQISGEGDHFVPPRDPDYHVPSIGIRAGETLKRTVNLHELYALGDFGIFRIRANIYFAETDKYFSSKPTFIEVTEGRPMWRRAAGVPGAGQTHMFSLLTHRHGEHDLLYVRVEDQENGTVFCTTPLGRVIDGAQPQVQFDSANNLFVLQLVGQRSYMLTKIGVNGEYLGQTHYGAPKTRPTLRKLADGTLQIVGGKREDPIAQNAQNATDAGPQPKLSDRPPGLPGN